MASLLGSVIVPVTLGAIGLGVFGAMDFTTRKLADETLTAGTYFTELPARMATIFEKAPPRANLEKLIPEAPRGWHNDEFIDADYAELTGLAPAEPQIPSELEEALENNLSFQIVSAVQQRGFQQTLSTYRRGHHQMMILALRYRPARVTSGIGGAQMSMMIDMMQMDIESEHFATVQGLDFEIKQIDGSERGRRIVAHLGQQVDIELVTNSTGEAVFTLLQDIDIAALNSLLTEPELAVATEDALTEMAASTVEQEPIAQEAEIEVIEEASNGSFIQQLFGGADEAQEPEVKLEANALPSVRRGANGQSAQQSGQGCSIEGGVRRCRVGN